MHGALATTRILIRSVPILVIAAAGCTNTLSADRAVVPVPSGSWWCDVAVDGGCHHGEAECTRAAAPPNGEGECAGHPRASCVTYLAKDGPVSSWRWACWPTAAACEAARERKAADSAVRKVSACEWVEARADG